MSTGELGELFPHVDLKFLDQRSAQRLSGYQTLLDSPAIDGALDLEQRIDPAHHLDRDRRQRDFLLAGSLASRILFDISHGEERKPRGCHDMGFDHAQQGIQRRTDRTDGVGHGRQRDRYAFQCIALGLAV